ncbi:hypothetical protein BJ508DRAFT_163495 [Ascobolus immersus RN42]|uniref:Uncharacterized protein n=1 Tax=Ascobolus immersus RN42 TaxID=1160509 RepID=A0A3N4I0T4_ASCIM|nr:hypothetical protein BJ508DRAFT_163495 [Ascobolus immersus RN42]
MLSPDAAEGAIRIPLDEITLPSQLSPTPSAHTMQPLGAPSNGSKSATTPASSTSTSTAPAPVAPRRTGLRAPSRLGTMNTSHLPAPRRIPISTTTKTRKHTELNIVAGRVAPITIEEKYIPHPKSPSPTPEERSYQAAIDRRRRKRIEAERGVTLGAGDESDFSPGRDMSGRKIKFLPKLEKREVPKLPLGSKQPEKGILKPLRKRLDNFGNLQDVDDLELSPPQPVTVLKVVYADEREERRGRDELEDIEEEDEWVEDDSISA